MRCLGTWTRERPRFGRLPEFDRSLVKYLFETYNELPHSKLDGQSPRERYEKGLVDVGPRRPRKQVYDKKFHMLTLAECKRGTAKVSDKCRIQVENIVYSSRELGRFVGERVSVRVDPDDVGIVYAQGTKKRGEWIECRCEHYSVLKGKSAKEKRLACAIIRARAGKGRPGPRVRAAAPGGLIMDVHSEEVLLRQRKRDEERKMACLKRGGAGSDEGEVVQDTSTRVEAEVGEQQFTNGKLGKKKAWSELPRAVEME